jgi:predicted nucleotidyltransferase
VDRRELEGALADLAARLRRNNVTARIYVVGGAAMALAYDAERTTRDVDGIVLEGHGEVMAAAAEVARDRSLPRSWLNEQASAYVPRGPDRRAIVVFDDPNLRVIAASAEHLLVMKAVAARATDIDDIETLLHLTGVATFDALVELCRRVLPDQPLPDRARAVLSELFDEQAPGPTDSV